VLADTVPKSPFLRTKKLGVLTPPFTNPDVSAVPPLAIGNVPVTLLAKFID
jgi:hypothetical protein